ncbi:MAG: DUF1015 domain-containing protein [Spirochaetales bacterium]|nr:DUF1015 domain-containing protein [Spirochaetales bacterium]MCF7938220.1 DUF1015 domain-containing protein [Spirochaetales bacterium]
MNETERKEIDSRFARLGVKIPEILIPRGEIDLYRWSVIACDQFTSQPEYWETLEERIGELPSTYHMILPECFLDKDDKNKRIEKIHQSMSHYLDSNVFSGPLCGFILTERTLPSGAVRHGLILAVDLDEYEYTADAHAKIRSTEGTILERIPPRQEVRSRALLELPHILLLVDDKEDQLLGSLRRECAGCTPVYETPLQSHGGSVRGYLINDGARLQTAASALEAITQTTSGGGSPGETEKQELLFAVGDGNHSLAAAKSHWESLKSGGAPSDHPARWALVEVINLYDKSLEFEAIHRLITGTDPDAILSGLEKAGFVFSSNGEKQSTTKNSDNIGYAVEYVSTQQEGILHLERPVRLPLKYFQQSLDEALSSAGKGKIDYIHGEHTLRELAGKDNERAGFVLPSIDKSELFPYILRHGPFPRKAFSMGGAEDKRYYLEARLIVPESEIR